MATAYTNYGGSGPRAGVFTITSTMLLNSGGADIYKLVDGVTGTLAVFPSPTGQAVAGLDFTFEFNGSARVIDAFKIWQNTTGTTTSWKFQGWNGSSWVDLHSFSWTNASPITESFTNTTAYQKYRFLGVSGTFGPNSLYEFEFSTEAHSAYETGNRTATITASTNLATSGGTASNSVDGAFAQNGTDSWWFSPQTLLTTHYIRWQFSAAQTIIALQMLTAGGVGNATGNWKVQGSNDGSTWTDLSPYQSWVFADASKDQGYWLFQNNTTAYTYYQLISDGTGSASSTAYQMETLFDTGAFTKALPNIRLTAEYAEVIDSGNDGVVRLSMLQAYSLDSGEPANALLTSLYVEVLSAVLPASEISGDTNAGVHQDITEFDDGSAPPDPIFLVAHLADDGGLDVLLNTNIATPFIARMTDDSILYARLTLPLHLVAHLEDDGRLNAFSLGLTPIPTVQSIVVMTGR
jgi:hypothetical protein